MATYKRDGEPKLEAASVHSRAQVSQHLGEILKIVGRSTSLRGNRVFPNKIVTLISTFARRVGIDCGIPINVHAIESIVHHESDEGREKGLLGIRIPRQS